MKKLLTIGASVLGISYLASKIKNYNDEKPIIKQNDTNYSMDDLFDDDLQKEQSTKTYVYYPDKDEEKKTTTL